MPSHCVTGISQVLKCASSNCVFRSRVDSHGKVRVDRVVCALDCGVAVNPDVIRAQVEGGIGFGLSAFLYGAITLKGGKVEQSNFHDYRLYASTECREWRCILCPLQ